MGNVEVLAWQWTPGWGNAFTVLIASIALIASVAVSWITLRRNAQQFEQRRDDEVTDKLRAEIIDLSTGLIERDNRLNVVAQRMGELTEATGHDMSSLEYHMGARSILTEELSPIYQRIAAHAEAIVMLTSEQVAIDSAEQISEAARQERQAYFEGIPIDDLQELFAHNNRVETLFTEIESARLQLLAFAREQLRAQSKT